MFRQNYAFYEDKYKEIINGAFADDPKSYKRLLKAIHYFYTNKCQEAVKLLTKLESSCNSIDEITTVLTFKALSYKDMKLLHASAETYEKLLQQNVSCSRAWSNLSLLYGEMGKMREAGDALRNAVVYDPENAFAYTNLAAYYTQIGEPEKALENALRALKINPRLAPAMSAASLAYAMLGDTANCEKYCSLYGASGGDTDKLRIVLSRV